MTFDLADFQIRQAAAVTATLDGLETLGAVTAKDAKAARAAIARADHAQALSRTYETHVAAAVAAAGDQLTHTDDLTLGAVLDAVQAPSAETVDGALYVVWAANVKAARNLAFANKAKVPGLLNEQFDAIATRTAEVLSKLGPNTTAVQAIDRGLTVEFREVDTLRAAYEGACELRSTLRSYGIIPGGDGYSSGWSWNFRKEFTAGAFKRAGEQPDPARARFLVAIAHEPYCAASEAEARAVLEAAQREQVTA
uniref:hypothetical protein n=1 Tax=Gordonia sp. B7-2 TaxID=3420932 RepID=UPI003D8D4570